MRIEWKNGRTPGLFGWFNWEKFLVIGIIVILLSFIIAVGVNSNAVAADAQHGARTVQKSDLVKPPLTAILISRCGRPIIMYFTSASGELLRLTSNSDTDLDGPEEAIKWGASSTGGAESVFLPCIDGPSQDTGLRQS